MQENEEVVWSDKYVSGNQEIDSYHKLILDGVVELYKMLEDSARYRSEIPVLTRKIEAAMYAHMDIEIECLKKFDLPEWGNHEKSHNFYRKNLDLYKSYLVPDVIRAVMTGEISRDYMTNHFFKYDIKDIPLINEELCKMLKEEKQGKINSQ